MRWLTYFRATVSTMPVGMHPRRWPGGTPDQTCVKEHAAPSNRHLCIDCQAVLYLFLLLLSSVELMEQRCTMS